MRTIIPAGEIRFCFVVDDYGAAVRLYRDLFGLDVLEELDGQGGRGIILKVQVATMELVDMDHGGMVDEIEVGRQVQDRVRIAVKVDNLAEAGRALSETGAEAMAAPVQTPWGDRNQRFRAKDGLQLTLFESP